MTTPDDHNRDADINPLDDPQLTAYALGEFDGDEHRAERAAVEARLADDPALQARVEQVALLAEQLVSGYADSAEGGLPDAARAVLAMNVGVAVEAATPTVTAMHTDAPGNNNHAPNPLARLLPYAAVAACAAGATAVGFLAFQDGSNTSPPASSAGITSNESPFADPAIPADPADPADPDQVEPTDPTESHNPVDPPSREALALALETPVSVDYDDAPLGEVLDGLRASTGVDVVVNWPGIDLVGIDPETRITLRLTDVPARTVLDYTLRQASAQNFEDDKIGYRIGERTVEIATLAELKTATEVRVYDIRQLLSPRQSVLAQFEERLLRTTAVTLGSNSGGGLFGNDDGPTTVHRLPDVVGPVDRERGGNHEADRLNGRPRAIAGPEAGDIRDLSVEVPRFDNAPTFDLNEALSNTDSGGSNNRGGGGLFGDDDGFVGEDTPTREEILDDAVELIMDTTGDPVEWLDQESTIRELNGTLIIKTTPENHAEIAELLARLGAGAAPPPSDVEGLADDPERLEQLAALFAQDLEQRLIDLREREQEREAVERWREQFAQVHDNPFHTADERPLSTFSVDVDTASYAIARRSLLDSWALPDPTTIRIEEFINYFRYDYDAPAVPIDLLDDGLLTTAALERLEARDESFTPFATHVEVTDCPWAEGHQLVRIGIKGMEVDYHTRPAAHLTFLLDVSGSMNNADKLPLVKDAMVMLLDQLRDDDRVSIVVYAGGTGSVIEGVPASDYERIRDAIDTLQTSGGTNGEAGIKLAYELAERYYVPGGVNRVVLCTDGDFNVGVSGTDELVELIQAKANPAPLVDGGPAPAVYLTVFGFGTGNLNDDMMERLTNAGNGNYAYLDSVDEAARALSDQVNGTLVTIAKDVKVQIEFNPAQVAAYRLIGYENRVLNAEDFNNDTVDAGDIGAGHTVTALYEIVPARPGAAAAVDALPAEGGLDALRYQRPRELTEQAQLAELLMLKLRYKPVDAAAEQGTSRRVVRHVAAQSVPFDEASETTRFAAAVACFGMTLRGSPHRGTADLEWIIATADAARQHDPHGYREQFLAVAERARGLIEPEAGEE